MSSRLNHPRANNELRPLFYLFVVATVGERPLGIQAGQIVSIAQWSKSQFPRQNVTLLADGPRSSLFSLIAAAQAGDAVQAVDLSRSFGSLQEIIESDFAANQYPELFCFGLLDQFDVLQLAAIVAPRPVFFHHSSQPAQAHLKPLAGWYATLGKKHNPIAGE